MTAIVAAATGFWDDTATWVGGVVPVTGDTVSIGAFTVTVRDARTVGHSPPENDATAAITFTSVSGVLEVLGATLTVRGDILMLGSGTVREQLKITSTGSARGVIEFDASQATTPMSQNYRLRVSQGNSQYAKVRLAGSAAYPAGLRSNAGGGNAFITRGGFFSTGQFEADFALFERIGDATNDWYSFTVGNVSASMMRLRDCVFDGCGRINSAISAHASAVLELRRVVTKNSAHATQSVVSGPAGGTAKGFMTDCHFDKEVNITDLANWTLDDTVFEGALQIAGSNAWDSAERCFMRITSLKQVNGPVIDWYVLIDHTAINPHALQPRSNNIAGHFEGVIFDYRGTSPVGDLININPGAAGGRSVIATRCIVLRNANGDQPGKLLSILGANNRVEAYHNTIIGTGNGTQSECGVIEYGEGGNGVDGDILGCKSNLVIGSVANGAVVLSRDIANTTQLGTLTTAGMFSHNAKYQPRTGSTDGDGYHGYHPGATPIFTAGTPGASDITLAADPCVDSTRNARTWDTSLGGPGTNANVMAELRKRHDFTESWNAAYSMANLLAYIHAGFEVTDAALNNAGHDGDTIGARAYIPITGNPYTRRDGGFLFIGGGCQ